MRKAGLRINNIQGNAKDLGLDLNLTNKRSTKIMGTCVHKALSASLRVKRFLGKTKNKQNTLLHETGVLPKLWGYQATGTAPAVVNSVRRRFAVDGSMWKRAGCTTSALAIVIGRDKDPGVFIPLNLIGYITRNAAERTHQASMGQKITEARRTAPMASSGQFFGCDDSHAY